jgi:hypothetical protein
MSLQVQEAAPLSHQQVLGLFQALADDELQGSALVEVKAHLDRCVDCRAGWQRYEGVVEQLRGLGPSRAPRGLASLILTRARRRSGMKRLTSSLHAFRVPAEALVLLLAAAVAVVVLLLLRA